MYRIISKLKLLTNKFFWYDVKYLIRRIVRFPKRIYEWRSILFNHEYWSDSSIIDLLQFSLEKLKKENKYDTIYVNSDKRAREIFIVLEHIKRYKDIDKYTLDNDTDEYLNNSYMEEITEGEHKGYFMMKYRDEKLHKKHSRVVLHQRDLEQWHYNEIWRRMKKLQRWGL